MICLIYILFNTQLMIVISLNAISLRRVEPVDYQQSSVQVLWES